MSTHRIALRDADEIERFYLETTGMRPDYLQLSAGRAGIVMQVDELAGVTLVWSRVNGRSRWRDAMSGDGLHLGFAIESHGPIVVRGYEVGPTDVQVWIPGSEMDYLMTGPCLTLEIGVERVLVDELGWQFGGEPLRRVPRQLLERLVRTCRNASNAAARTTAVDGQQWRDQVLDELEHVVRPWFSRSGKTRLPNPSGTRAYSVVKRADEFFESLDSDAGFDVDRLADSIGVARRTVFYAYRRVLGIGPRRYFELRRLRTLRSRLKQAGGSGVTVTDIATELGFSSLGRLASVYKAQFGEFPSRTLRSGT